MNFLKSKGLSSLLQHHNSKTSILGPSAIFIVHLSHPYMTTGKTIALTRPTFVGKTSSLFFNTLSRYHNLPSKEQVSFIFMAAVTVCSDFGAQENKICHCFHPRDKHLLISWVRSLSAVILESKKIKFATVSIFSPFYLP